MAVSQSRQVLFVKAELPASGGCAGGAHGVLTPAPRAALSRVRLLSPAVERAAVRGEAPLITITSREQEKDRAREMERDREKVRER